MLSNYIYSKYAINKSYNDDIKLFTPYYFELISNSREVETGYWEFEHCKVKLNSLYFNFSGGSIQPTPINYWGEVEATEKQFNTVDNKYYFVVWHGNKNNDWKIVKFKNDIDLNTPLGKRNLDNLSGYNLNLTNSSIKGINLNIVNCKYKCSTLFFFNKVLHLYLQFTR